MKRLISQILVVILCFYFQVGFGQQIQLTENAQVSVLTIGPGNNLEDSFGHSAIRINDPIKGINYVYNYGIFDFETPNFLIKFARGKLLYILGVESFNNFIGRYKQEKRWVKEQILDLDLLEKQAFLDFLNHNAKPENRGYLYDFFYDNCATKLTEITSKILGDKVNFDLSFTNQNSDSMRDLIHKYTYAQAWGEFGIDLALGAVIDKKATPKEYQFLPDNIYASFKNATILGKPLVKEERSLLSFGKRINFGWGALIPLAVFSILAIIVILLTIRDYKRGKRSRWLDFILFFSTGLIGLLMLLLWFATDHSATANNFNVLWAFMPNLIVAFFIHKKSLKPWIRKYTLLLVALVDLTVILWLFGIQSFPWAIIPILILLSVRYLYLLIGNSWKSTVQ